MNDEEVIRLIQAAAVIRDGPERLAVYRLRACEAQQHRLGKLITRLGGVGEFLGRHIRAPAEFLMPILEGLQAAPAILGGEDVLDATLRVAATRVRAGADCTWPSTLFRESKGVVHLLSLPQQIGERPAGFIEFSDGWLRADGTRLGPEGVPKGREPPPTVYCLSNTTDLFSATRLEVFLVAWGGEPEPCPKPEWEPAWLIYYDYFAEGIQQAARAGFGEDEVRALLLLAYHRMLRLSETWSGPVEKSLGPGYAFVLREIEESQRGVSARQHALEAYMKKFNKTEQPRSSKESHT